METFEDVVVEVKKLDPNLDENSDEFKAAACLLSCLLVRPRLASLMDFTPYQPKFLSRIGKNLRKNRIWDRDFDTRKNVFCPSDWFNEETGGVAFWMDVSCALGFIERTNN